MKKVLTYTVSILPFIFNSSFAEEELYAVDAAQDSYYTQEVIVSATQTENAPKDLPSSTALIEPAESHKAVVSDVSDLFDNVSGVEIGGGDRTNGQYISMRGYSEDSINITIDGVPQRLNSSYISGIFIDPTLLSRVEVVKGPGSTIYGSGSLGGLVSYRTVEADDIVAEGDKFGVRSYGGFRSANKEVYMGSLAGFRGDSYDGVVGLTWRKSEDIDLSDDTTILTDENILNGLAKFNYYINDAATLHLGVIGSNGDFEEPSAPTVDSNDTSARTITDRNIRTITSYLGFDYDSPSNDWVNFKSKIFWDHKTIDEEYIASASATYSTGDTADLEYNTYGFNFNNLSEFDLGLSNHRLLFGGDITKDEQDASYVLGGVTQERSLVPDATTTDIGVYLQDEITFDLAQAGRLIITPGIRYDYYDIEKGNSSDTFSQDHFSPKLGLTYQPTEWLSLYGNYAHGFGTPGLVEIFGGTHQPVPFIVMTLLPNYNLKPETNDTFELGFGIDTHDAFVANDSLNFRASGFYTKSDNKITTNLISQMGPYFTYQYVNVPSATIYGFDASVSYDSKYFFFDANYSYVTGEDDETGDYLSSIAMQPHTFKTVIGANVPRYDLSFGVESTYALRFDEVNDIADEMPGYGVHGVFINWQPEHLNNLKVSASIDNIFDKEYETIFAGMAAEGRSYNVGFSMDW